MLMQTQYLGNLTPLRGIAALLIVIFHINLSFFGGAITGSWQTSLISQMYTMVDFFFMLSGFIMLHVYGNWFIDGVTPNHFKKFMIARFARVYPLHLFTLLLVAVIIVLYRYKIGPIENPFLAAMFKNKNIPANLLLLQGMNITDYLSWNVPAWSISTEWWAYVLFPLLILVFPKSNNTLVRTVMFVGCFAAYICLAYFFSPMVTLPALLSFLENEPASHSIDVTYQFGFLRCMTGFIAGMLSYQIYKDNQAKKLFSSTWVVVILGLGLFGCMHFGVADYLTVWFFPLIILSAAHGNPTLNSLLGSKSMQGLGDWSFSIYLLHFPLIVAINLFVPDLSILERYGFPSLNTPIMSIVFTLVLLMVIILLSSISYKLVEVPARRALNRS